MRKVLEARSASVFSSAKFALYLDVEPLPAESTTGSKNFFARNTLYKEAGVVHQTPTVASNKFPQ